MQHAPGILVGALGEQRLRLRRGSGLAGDKLAQYRLIGAALIQHAAHTRSDIDPGNGREIRHTRQRLGAQCRRGGGGGSGDPRRHPVQQQSEQLIGIDRLGQVSVHPGRQAEFTVTAHGIGGHGQHRQPGPAWVGADMPARRQAIHHRHLHIHQHQLEISPSQHVQGQLAIVRHLDQQPRSFE